VVLVTIERFSFTTKILLPPDNFLRLHEVFQIVTLILFTVLIHFFVLKEVTGNFKDLQTKRGFWLTTIFIIGIYLYATGNGVHELGSFIFNSYCPLFNFTSAVCKSAFINDYYFGNGLYFVGAYLMTIPLILFERRHPSSLDRRNLIILFINSLVYALAIFAYAAFDRVAVGLIFSVITLVSVLILLRTAERKYTQIPFTLYTAIAYGVGTIGALLVKVL
jgi:hypothetical protein